MHHNDAEIYSASMNFYSMGFKSHAIKNKANEI